MRKTLKIWWFILLDMFILLCKLIKMLSLYFYKLMGKTEEHKGKNIWGLMIICNFIKEIIGIEKFDDTKILISTDDKKGCDIINMFYKR